MGADGKREFRISPLAQGDLEDIWSFTVETWTWEQAGKYHSDLLRTFAQLAGGDLRGREVMYGGDIANILSARISFFIDRALTELRLSVSCIAGWMSTVTSELYR